MCKKAAIGAGVLFVVGALIFGVSNMVSMMKVGGHKVSDYVNDQVPISAKIELLDQKLNELGPKIDDGKRIVAKQEIRVKKLNGEIEEKMAALDKQWNAIVELREAVAKDEPQYVYAGQTYTKEEVQSDLEKKYDRYKAAEDAANQQKELLTVRQRVLKANQQSLANLADSQAKLNIMIEKLRARQETIKAKQIENLQTVDDSPTGDIKKLYDSIDEQLSVEERLIEMEGDDVGEIKVNETKKQDILEEIDARRAEKAVDGKKTELIKSEIH